MYHIPLHLPNPLSRLTQILVHLERGRAASAPPCVDAPVGAVMVLKTPSTPRPNDGHDMMFLSLCRHETAITPQCEDLEFMAMERHPESPHDSLCELGLSKPRPRKNKA